MKDNTCDQDFLELIIEVAQDPDWIPEDERAPIGETSGLFSVAAE